jgi:hypothetical protein
MKKTIEQCDLCGLDITGLWDGIIELWVDERIHDCDRPRIFSRKILICPFCKKKIQQIFMG